MSVIMFWGLDGAELLWGRFLGFGVQVFVFEQLRVVQNHTVELCKVTNGSSLIVGIV